MNALNIKTGTIWNDLPASGPRHAVRLAFLTKHEAQGRVELSFLRTEPREPLGLAFGDWVSFSVRNPVGVLADLAYRRDVADREAALVVVSDRRQRRKARAGYLGKRKALRSRACASIFKSTADALGVAV